MGLVNDHIDNCGVRMQIETLRAQFTRPRLVRTRSRNLANR